MKKPLQFQRHYTVSEARNLLPAVAAWLNEARELQARMERSSRRILEQFGEGRDLGGPRINDDLRALARLKEVFEEFESREIVVKDFERGLVDFPSLRNGREVFLCWEEGESDIEFWHDLEGGFAGRAAL
jgi:hypothetical protein